MGEVLVLVEQAGGVVRKVTTELLTLARDLGEPSAVWVGPGFDDAAAAVLGSSGRSRCMSPATRRSGSIRWPRPLRSSPTW